MENREKALIEVSKQEKQFDALYRNVTNSFGFPDCTMWVLYFIASAREDITQQKLIDMMMFPKQTINSAVKGLVQKGYVALEVIPGTRNKKKIILTKDGVKAVEDTVLRLRKAELAAVKKFGEEKMANYIELYTEFYNVMKEEFEKAGILDE